MINADDLDQDIRELAYKCNKLKTIDVVEPLMLQETTIRAFVFNCPRLTYFCVGCLFDLDFKYFVYSLRGFPQESIKIFIKNSAMDDWKSEEVQAALNEINLQANGRSIEIIGYRHLSITPESITCMGKLTRFLRNIVGTIDDLLHRILL